MTAVGFGEMLDGWYHQLRTVDPDPVSLALSRVAVAYRLPYSAVLAWDIDDQAHAVAAMVVADEIAAETCPGCRTRASVWDFGDTKNPDYLLEADIRECTGCRKLAEKDAEIDDEDQAYQSAQFYPVENDRSESEPAEGDEAP